jgi:hypothetical protein
MVLAAEQAFAAEITDTSAEILRRLGGCYIGYLGCIVDQRSVCSVRGLSTKLLKSYSRNRDQYCGELVIIGTTSWSNPMSFGLIQIPLSFFQPTQMYFAHSYTHTHTHTTVSNQNQRRPRILRSKEMDSNNNSQLPTWIQKFELSYKKLLWSNQASPSLLEWRGETNLTNSIAL